MPLMFRLLKLLPESANLELKRLRYQYLIRRNQFRSGEKEFDHLGRLINPGDTVIDIGANVGHYTLKFAELVGPEGRVLAFEPIARTFDLLSSNIVYSGFNNISIFGCAITDVAVEVSFSVPDGNYYQSYLSLMGDHKVMGYPLTNFLIPNNHPSLLKIDAEGCDEDIVVNITDFLKTARPIVMVEISGTKLIELAMQIDRFGAFAIRGSHNGFLVPEEKASRMSDIGATPLKTDQ